jgi:ribose-phosphate pyrophosphokinase
VKDVVVLPGPSSLDLGNLIAEKLKVESIPVDTRVFSDGESKIRINSDLNNKKCVVVQSTYPPVDSSFLQAFMIVSSCYASGAAEVIVIMPYMGYARQDRSFLEGECVTISLIASMLECIRVRNLVTVDIHSERALSYFNLNILNISSVKSLASYALKQFDLSDPVVVSPDIGGLPRAKEFSQIIGSACFGLKKNRDRLTGEVVIDENLEIAVQGRDIIFIDDMISSGGTILKALDLMKKNHCRKVYAMCVHALADELSINSLRNAGLCELVSTNSVPRSCSHIDLSQEISKIMTSSAIL